MTTYITHQLKKVAVTTDPHEFAFGQEICRPYCSLTCVPMMVGFNTFKEYEFDETCATCGAHIPATVTIEEILAIEEAIERQVITTEEAARRLRARYAPGIKEVH